MREEGGSFAWNIEGDWGGSETKRAPCRGCGKTGGGQRLGITFREGEKGGQGVERVGSRRWKGQ